MAAIMWNDVMVGLKPGTDWSALLALAGQVTAPGGCIVLTALSVVGKHDDEAARLAATDQALEAARGELEGAGYRVTTHGGVVALSPGGQLVQLASDEGCGAIVIGLAKRSRVGKALMGSDSQRVLLESKVPVIAQRIT